MNSFSASKLGSDDWRTISLVGLAHGTSHFFHLLLVPMFPLFGREFGLSWTELGLFVTLFYGVSGVGQAASGFLVDRVGARPVLWAALGAFTLAALAAASAQGPWGLALAAALAGLGNAPFHPADFSILNQRVATPRLGHAYAVHGVSGNLGWALTPVFLVGLWQASGSWRLAYLGMALVALAVLLTLVLQGRWLETPPVAPRRPGADGALAFLRLPALWLAFSFFLLGTAALAAVQSFAAPALASLHQVPVERLALLVTLYMLAGALGMVLGGFWVARTQQRLERRIAWALLLAALLLLASTLPGLAWSLALALVVAAGLGTGLAGPSRDLLVKQATPPGATGRVVGTVYSGLDIGFALGAPLAGAAMDAGQPRGVLWLAAAGLLLALLAAQAVAWFTSRSAPPRPAG
ncbi:MFS transporter [Inhella sp.]|uniref:MFS transporter n=1 Tax=Inhella sp. TaxID=1921806 RepID=UPI0035B0A9AF